MRNFKLLNVIGILFLFANCQKDDATNDETYQIGQKHEGGVIFHLDGTQKHGLIALEFDLPLTYYGCWGNVDPIATATEIGSGKLNTDAIASNCDEAPAAKKCLELYINGFQDWYLPSINELEQIYLIKDDIGHFRIDELAIYLSSSEAPAEMYQGEMIYSKAWTYNFLGDFNGIRKEAFFKNRPLPVRPIRSF